MIATGTSDDIRARLEALDAEREAALVGAQRALEELRTAIRCAEVLDVQIQDLRCQIAICSTFGRQA